jgi:hypothetical protein
MFFILTAVLIIALIGSIPKWRTAKAGAHYPLREWAWFCSF